MSIDLSTLSVPELERLIKDAGTRIETLKRESYVSLRRNLEAQAREAGFDVYALFGSRVEKAARTAGEAKYRNPKNPEQTWAGIGKRPDWLRAAINAGETLESMRVL